MENDRGVLRAVSWRDVCPWLLIFRSFRIAIAPHVLLLAMAGTLLVPLGWRFADLLFVEDEVAAPAAGDRDRIAESLSDAELNFVAEQYNHWPAQHASPRIDEPQQLAAVYIHRFVEPFMRLFDPRVTASQFAYFLFGGLWTLLVWAFFGGAITRSAVMRLGCEERVSLRASLKFALKRLRFYFSAPVSPLIGVLVCAAFVFVAGLLMKLDIGVVLVAILWFLVLLAGFVMALLLLGLLAGWPLSWGNVSADGGDSFEALQHIYDYPLKRPLHLLFYLLVALLFGHLCWWLVDLFADAILNLSYWATSWGTGNKRMFGEILTAEEPPQSGALLVFGNDILQFWTNVIRTVVMAFVFGFFWCAVSAIYLVLRLNVEEKEFDEIYLEEEEDRYQLPPSKSQDSAPQPASDEPAKVEDSLEKTPADEEVDLPNETRPDAEKSSTDEESGQPDAGEPPDPRDETR